MSLYFGLIESCTQENKFTEDEYVQLFDEILSFRSFVFTGLNNCCLVDVAFSFETRDNYDLGIVEITRDLRRIIEVSTRPVDRWTIDFRVLFQVVDLRSRTREAVARRRTTARLFLGSFQFECRGREKHVVEHLLENISSGESTK